MSDDDKLMDFQFICNQHVVTYNKLQVMNPMLLSAPWADSLDMISVRSVRKIARSEPHGP